MNGLEEKLRFIAEVCLPIAMIYAAIFVVFMVIASEHWCQPSNMSRLRYALGGNVACWLMEPVEQQEVEHE